MSRSTGVGRGLKRTPALDVDADLLLSRDEQAEMVEQWRLYGYGLARSFHRHCQRWMTREDCESTAVVGLWEAARRFQPGKGFQFGTYATYWVRQVLQREKRKAMGIPCHLKFGSQEMRRALGVAGPLSLNYRIGNSEEDVAAVTTGKEDDRPEFPDDFWDRVYKFLQPRLRDVIRLRFREGKTLVEAGEVLGVTRERVRQLEGKALRAIGERVDFGDCLDQFTFAEHALVR